jgi:hypothetical protein
MLDWNVYPTELSARVKEMSKLAPNGVTGFMRSTTVSGRPPTSTQRPASSCHRPSQHVCWVHGATPEEVAEALGVAIAPNAGAALAYTVRMLDAIRRWMAQQRPPSRNGGRNLFCEACLAPGRLPLVLSRDWQWTAVW